MKELPRNPKQIYQQNQDFILDVWVKIEKKKAHFDGKLYNELESLFYIAQQQSRELIDIYRDYHPDKKQ